MDESGDEKEKRTCVLCKREGNLQDDDSDDDDDEFMLLQGIHEGKYRYPQLHLDVVDFSALLMFLLSSWCTRRQPLSSVSHSFEQGLLRAQGMRFLSRANPQYE